MDWFGVDCVGPIMELLREVLLVADRAFQGSLYTGKFMRPSYLINIGSEVYSSENGREIISVFVDRNMGLPTDRWPSFPVPHPKSCSSRGRPGSGRRSS